jgi:hypothetical protein
MDVRHSRVVPVVAAVASLAAARPAFAGYAFTTVDVPGASSTAILDINNSGQMVGLYTSAGVTSGFVDTNGVITTIAVPGATTTVAYAISNSGTVVGQYLTGGYYYGFIDNNGSFTTVNVPGYQFPISQPNTQVALTGVNDKGEVTGFTETNGTQFHSFTVIGGNVAINDPPYAPGLSEFYKINSSGQIVGFTYGGSIGATGFLYSGGVFSPFNVPGPNLTPEWTEALGLDDNGDTSGYYFDSKSSSYRGFVDIGGNFTSIDAPGNPSVTVVWGLNDSGTIAGEYVDSSGDVHGFMATADVPEPPSLPLLITSIFGIALARSLPVKAVVISARGG